MNETEKKEKQGGTFAFLAADFLEDFWEGVDAGLSSKRQGLSDEESKGFDLCRDFVKEKIMDTVRLFKDK